MENLIDIALNGLQTISHTLPPEIGIPVGIVASILLGGWTLYKRFKK